MDAMFSYISMSQFVPESLMNAIGGLSGSGPAFVSYHNNIIISRKLIIIILIILLYFAGISYHRSIGGWRCKDGCTKANGD